MTARLWGWLRVAGPEARVAVWGWLREVSGDDAYERYLAAGHADGGKLSRGEFYRQHLEQKYSRPCRCC